MTRNPCRNCEEAYVYKNKHMAGWDCRFDCKKHIAHQKYLESKRLFKKGERIKTLDELLDCDWVMWGDRPRHIEVVKCMQLASVLRFLEMGYFNRAIRKEVVNE